MSFPLTKKSSQWQNDNLVNDCNVCKRKIVGKYFKSGKHHCRKCGRIICSDCSKHKYMNHRICYDCNIILNPIHNTQQINPYIDSNVIKAQREFSPEKNKQFEYEHQIIVKSKSKSKTNNKPKNIHPKPFKPTHSNRYIPPPPPLPPPPPPPLTKKQSNKKIHINGKNTQKKINNITHKKLENTAINIMDEKEEKYNEKIDNKISDMHIEKKQNGTMYTIDTYNNKNDIEKHEENKDNNIKTKKDKKHKRKRDKRRKKHKKHSKHHRNEAVTEMDDITTEIFLKLLLSFEALEEDEEKKRKKRKKRKKKARSQRSRSKQRKSARNNHNHKVIQNIKQSETETVIITNQEQIIKKNKIIKQKQIIKKKPEINEKIILPNSQTDEIKVIETQEIEFECDVKTICCGASMMKYRNKWVKLHGNTFNIRPKNYYSKKKKGKKMPSKNGIYNVFAVDAYSMNEKLKFWDVMNKYNIDIYKHINGEKKYFLPYLVIVNVMLPLKNNKKLQLTFYSKLSDETIKILNRNNVSASMELFKKFINFCMGNEDEMADELEEAFKMTVRVNNLKETKLPFLMKKLIKRASGQSIAINENSEYFLDKTKNVFVIDIDGYKLSKSSLRMWNKINLVLDSIIYDVGFHIGAHDVNYLPEQILLCARINKLSVNDFTSIERMII